MSVALDPASVAREIAGAVVPAQETNGNGAHDQAPRTRFVDWETFFEKDRTDPEWLFEDVLARGRGHSIWAKHGTGKSLFSLWMATQIVKAGHVVVYADWEMGEDDLYERLSDMGFGPESDLSRLRYLLLPDLAPLNTDEGARQMCGLVDEVQAEWPDCNLTVVIDTIGRAVVGEENSNDTIQEFYRHTGLGLKQRGVTWVRLDHAGHEGAHARGASAKGDDVDIIWKLSVTDDGIELRNDKRRMGWVPASVSFRIYSEPVLRYEKAPGSWPSGTQETARLLDDLDVPLTVGMRKAKALLREAGEGRRNQVVEAAQRWRRMLEEQRLAGRGTPPGTLSRNASGDTPGDAGQEPLVQGAGTPPGTLGDTPAARLGDTPSPLVGDGDPGARLESMDVDSSSPGPHPPTRARKPFDD